jgi:hypothetical protein
MEKSLYIRILLFYIVVLFSFFFFGGKELNSRNEFPLLPPLIKIFLKKENAEKKKENVKR